MTTWLQWGIAATASLLGVAGTNIEALPERPRPEPAKVAPAASAPPKRPASAPAPAPARAAVPAPAAAPSRVERRVGAFRSVAIRGAVDGEFVQGDRRTVRVEGCPAMVSRVGTFVRDGALVVELRGVEPSTGPVRVFVANPTFEGGALAGDAKWTFRKLDAPRLSFDLGGSGRVTAEGSAREVRVAVVGDGRVELGRLQTRRAQAQVTGGGRVLVAVRDRLDARVLGSGAILYLDSPTVHRSLSGSGRIAPAG